MTPNEQRAAELLASWQKWDRNIAYWISEVIVPKLATPDHEAALSACEAHAKAWDDALRGKHVPSNIDWTPSTSISCRDIGRRSLDAKKPKERWSFFDASALLPAADEFKYGVRETLGLGASLAYFRRAEDARAYAADMNAKEAGR